MALEFLLRQWRRAKDAGALDAVELTLNKMARGGIYDQLGGLSSLLGRRKMARASFREDAV